MANICTAPNEINSFFTNLYGKQPQVSQVKKNIVCSLAEAEVSVMIDSYGGCHVDIVQISKERLPIVQYAIEGLAEGFKATKTCDSLWINFALPTNPAVMGSVLPQSFEIGTPGRGDLIYDYQQKKLRVWQWLNPEKECVIPPGATHNIGATALLCDTAAKKVLLVVNVRRDKNWNLPGGSYDPIHDKTPADTALREAQEEGGLTIDGSAIKEQKLIGQMQFPQNQFAPAINQIWSFAVPGLSQLKLNPPPHEIKRAEWIEYQAIVESSEALGGYTLSEEIKAPLLAAIKGLGAQEIANKGWMIVHTSI
jgi:ADP-ribose pyrophosphatase YjhB (NUDIX family)